MIVRIRFHSGPKVSRGGRKNGHVALAAAALLTPGVLSAAALGFWRVGADMGVAGHFAIENGPFSHWQAWLAVAAVGQIMVVGLNRYGAVSGKRAAAKQSDAFLNS